MQTLEQKKRDSIKVAENLIWYVNIWYFSHHERLMTWEEYRASLILFRSGYKVTRTVNMVRYYSVNLVSSLSLEFPRNYSLRISVALVTVLQALLEYSG